MCHDGYSARKPAGQPGRENVEQPRTDQGGVSAEGRQQPVIEPQVVETPAPVADAPDTTTQREMHDDPTTLDQSGDPSAEQTGGEESGSRGGKQGRS